MKRSVLPPLCVLLLHLGACAEAIEWADGKPIAASTLAACEREDWRAWITDALGVSRGATFPELNTAALKALSGDGDGDGYGYGDGSGDGYGYGDGTSDLVHP